MKRQNRDRSRTKKVGRPKGATRVPMQRAFEVWLWVEYYRERALERDGNRPSVLAACNEICRGLGLNWAIGGSIEAISKSVAASSSSKDIQRRTLAEINGETSLIADKNGALFVSHSLRDPRSLRTRYTEAKQLVDSDSNTRKSWTNSLFELLGRPRPCATLPIGWRTINRS